MTRDEIEEGMILQHEDGDLILVLRIPRVFRWFRGLQRNPFKPIKGVKVFRDPNDPDHYICYKRPEDHIELNSFVLSKCVCIA